MSARSRARMKRRVIAGVVRATISGAVTYALAWAGLSAWLAILTGAAAAFAAGVLLGSRSG